MTLKKFLAAAAAGLLMAAPAFAKSADKPVQVTASEDYAKAVSAVCTILSPRDQASGLVYFLTALGSDKKPTKEATEAFCNGFKAAFPLTSAEADAVLTATAAAGGAPAPMKKDKDKDKKPPGGGDGDTSVRVKIKIFGIEFEIEVEKKKDTSTSSSSGDDGETGSGDSGSEGSPAPDSGTPPFNPRS